MLSHLIRTPRAAVLLVALTAALASKPALGAETAEYKALVDKHAPCVITIKFVLKVKSGGEEQEHESEASGVMIGAKGLVLCSNTRMGGVRGLNAKPTDMKILVGDDTEGVEATFLARDSELDLAWLQIKEPGDKKYQSLDLTASVTRLSRRRNRAYEFRYVRGLFREARDRHRRFGELEPLSGVSPWMSLRRFDDLYTAPRNGFGDAENYYRVCSALGNLSRVRAPTRLLFALDDPIVAPGALVEQP